MEYVPKYDATTFEDQCDNLLHASILASFSYIPPSSHEAPPSVPSSSSLKLKSLPKVFKYAFLCLRETFLMILANDLNLDQNIQVLDLLRENKGSIRVDLRRHSWN